MTEQQFLGGCKYYAQITALHKDALIERCKAKYPKENGRGVNFVMVPTDWLGECWMFGSIVDPGRFHIDKARVATAIDGLSQDSIDLIMRYIDDYDPDTELLFFIMCNRPKPDDGYWTDLIVI